MRKKTMLRDIDIDKWHEALQKYPLADGAFEFIQLEPHIKNALPGIRGFINDMIYERFKYYYIIQSPVADISDEEYFLNRAEQKMIRTMAQLQVPLIEFLKASADNRWFEDFEDETYDGETHQEAEGETDNLSKTSDTPQNEVADIDKYMSQATKDDGKQSSTADGLSKWHRRLDRSSLGFITTQFSQFVNTIPDFYDKIITEMGECFLQVFNYDDGQYNSTK